jgi:hypothetical protein
VREGDAFTAVIKFLGHRLKTPYERTSYEPNRRFTEWATLGFLPDQRWTYTFEEVPARTRLTRAVEGEPGGSSSWPTRASSVRSSAGSALTWRR